MAAQEVGTSRQAYEQVLLDRMLPVDGEFPVRPDSDCDDDAYDDRDEVPECAITRNTQAFTLQRQQDELVGSTMAGDEAFRFIIQAGLTAQELRSQVGQALGIDARSIDVLAHGGPVGDSIVVDIDAVVMKSTTARPTVFVCNYSGWDDDEPTLGEGAVPVRESLTNGIFQALIEPRKFVTQHEGAAWHVYGKDAIFVAAKRGCYIRPLGTFPAPPTWPLPAGGRQWGGPHCDVWSASVDLPHVQDVLEAHAALTNDRPLPRYQMVVDPNRFVREDSSGTAMWVPCEFDVHTNGTVHLVGGSRSHEFPVVAQQAATPVLAAALPLLAKLDRPRLLLADRRIQVVFKAQRIIVPPAVGDCADSEYVGLWHVDGHREHVAAVVLYYYNVSPALDGGDMEFCGREPMDVLGWGDCDNNWAQFKDTSLREALRATDADGSTATPPCRVPVSTGTLLVFSNYQMIHRVLRMVNTCADAEASRDFVALFIIDPAAKPLVSSRCHLAARFLLSRTLQSKCLVEPDPLRVILECLGELPSTACARKTRNRLLLEQLQPQGNFTGIGGVYSTGNGCYTMIGWLHNLLEDDEETDHCECPDHKPPAWTKFCALNLPPETLGRGMSEVFSKDSEELAKRLDTELHEG
eukprot:CAMPEP_0198499934 /NCGR_PEP_ID=MMETSP1462-20131121/7907_1 /TAXON_ID=1333877 /ORGANISM="Brandtodinium nutriculum, Strain RCC3387" /LENGTH=635 /DNA_ID=CAMNT_0044228937 /DNA_START=113 /DNA_END=2017 /DNA_ORIENTATION=+